MIFGSLALFFISFLITALLAPKVKVEDARADNLEDSQFPRATEDAPMPLALGTVRIRAVNTLWYGDFLPEAITERIRTGLFSKKTVITGYNYFLGLDLGLCLGPAALKKIYIDEKEVWKAPEGLAKERVPLPFTVGTSLETSSFTLSQVVPLKNVTCGVATYRIGFKFTYSISGGTGNIQNSSLRLRFYDSDDRLMNSESKTLTSNTEGGGSFLFTGTIPTGARRMEIQKYSVGLFPIYQTRTISDLVSYIEFDGYPEFCDTISQSELFGGEGEGGGWTGNFCYYPGKFTQKVDDYLEGVIGADMVPAYNGLAHIVFQGNYIGEQSTLRKIAAEVESFTSNISIACNDYGPVNGLDSEPAEAISEILLSGWRGLNIVPDDIDFPSFRTCATRLRNENNGVSVLVTSGQSGKEVISEILRQVDGVLYQDPETRKIVMRLIRDDYNEASLPVYDEDDIIEITSFTKTSWNDLFSQVKVSFPTRDSESSKVAVAQDMAIANQLGKIKTSQISFPFCYDKDLANRLAARELSRLSVPVFRMTLEMKRNSYTLRPGDVFKINWPSYGLYNVILRVQKHDLGSLLDNKIILECVQDIFAVSDVVIAPPVETGWSDERKTPKVIDSHEIVETPLLISKRNLPYPADSGFENVIAFARKPQDDSNRFTMISGIVIGELDVTDPSAIPYPVSFLMRNNYPRTAGFVTGFDATGFEAYSFSGKTGSGAPNLPSSTVDSIRATESGILFANGEWMAFQYSTAGFTRTLSNVYRGLFGTKPVDHPENSVVYYFDDNVVGSGELGNLLPDSGTLYYKLLDIAGGITKSRNSVDRLSKSITPTWDRPLRPRNLKVEGSRNTSIVYPRGSLTFSWASSNKEENSVSFENDSTQVPDQAETYDIDIMINGVRNATLSRTGVSSPTTISFASAGGATLFEARVYSRRTVGDLRSSRYYAFLPFELLSESIALSGDVQFGDDVELLSGDAQMGSDSVLASGE